jgi:hypothetical protein
MNAGEMIARDDEMAFKRALEGRPAARRAECKHDRSKCTTDSRPRPPCLVAGLPRGKTAQPRQAVQAAQQRCQALAASGAVPSAGSALSDPWQTTAAGSEASIAPD